MSTMRFLGLLSLLMAAAPAWADEAPALAPGEGAARVGFLTHPQFGGLEPLASMPVSAELANVFVWRTVDPAPATPEGIAVDFGPAADWLRQVYASNRVAYPILDTAVHHSNQPWRQELTRKLGENLVHVDGTVQSFSSLHSPLFRKTVLSYTDQLIDWVKANDRDKRIAGYVDGAEWFYPGMLDYSPLAFQAFRKSLQARYPTLEALNAAWGSAFASWEAVEPPRPWGVGHFDGGLQSFSIGRAIRASWASPKTPAQASTAYRVAAEAALEGVPEWMAAVEVHWFDDKDKEIGSADVFSFQGATINGGAVGGTVTAPAGTASVQLTAVLTGPGTAAFRTLSLRDILADRAVVELTAENAGEWTFWAYDNWGSGSADTGLTLRAPAPPLPFAHTAVALEDWITFCYESMAEWLNDCAVHIKARDPERPVTSYLGFVFATHSSWDYAMTMQRIDISLAHSPDIDVNAIQVCAAADDLTYPSCPVDVARKYGKPVWSYDLVDFPYGLHSGFDPIYRASMASIQHGSKGILYCQWVGAPYDYQYATCMPRADLNRMLADVETAAKALEGYRLETNVAFFMPLQSYSFADEGGYKSDMLDNGGLYHLVLDLGLTPDVYTPYEVTKRGADCFAGYDVLFLPDCPIIPAEAQAALVQFSQRGGVIVASGRLPERDLAGKAFAQALEPGRLIVLPEKAGRAYWGTVNRLRKYGNTPPVFLATDTSEEHRLRQRVTRETVRDRLAKTGVEMPGWVDPAQGNVHVATWQRPDTEERLFFLVNKGAGRVAPQTLTFRLRDGLKAQEALVDLERRVPLETSADGTVTLPDFTHTLLIYAGTPAVTR